MPELLSGESIGPWKVERTLTYGEPAWVAAHGDGVDAVLQVSKLHRMGQTWQDRAVAALQSLDHGAIPRLVDAGRANALLYVAMRPFPTDTLADRLFTGPVPVDLCCTWLHAVASALRHMHDAGWVHGDVAPQHIHVADDGRAWLYGMASAQRVGEAPRFTEELPARTLTHLAPEVLADPHHAPPRADIYAFGTVAYELLAGRPAFPAAAWAGRPDQQRMLLEWKTRARELDPGPPAPDWLRALVRKCTHPDAQQRLPDFDAVVAAGAKDGKISPNDPMLNALLELPDDEAAAVLYTLLKDPKAVAMPRGRPGSSWPPRRRRCSPSGEGSRRPCGCSPASSTPSRWRAPSPTRCTSATRPRRARTCTC